MSSAPEESRLADLELRVARLEEFRADYVTQFQELHRDLRAALNAIHRLIDDRVPLKLLLERAVNAAERAERKASESNTTSTQVLDRCAKNCVLAALHAQVEEGKKP